MDGLLFLRCESESRASRSCLSGELVCKAGVLTRLCIHVGRFAPSMLSIQGVSCCFLSKAFQFAGLGVIDAGAADVMTTCLRRPARRFGEISLFLTAVQWLLAIGYVVAAREWRPPWVKFRSCNSLPVLFSEMWTSSSRALLHHSFGREPGSPCPSSHDHCCGNRLARRLMQCLSCWPAV